LLACFKKVWTSEHTESFGPHLLHDDIKTYKPLTMLAQISPVFRFWHGLEHVAKAYGGKAVSLNLFDIVHNFANNVAYKSRQSSHLEKALWQEFIARYMEHPSVEQHMLGQLQPQTIPIEDLRPAQSPEREISELIEAGV
jgi:hypothetical protein